MIARIRQWLYNRRRARQIADEAWDKAAVAALGLVVLKDCRDIAEGRCNICGHQYVGLAMDCKCTNWGR